MHASKNRGGVVGFPVEKAGLPPMMLQYVEFKERYSDALLFFQVGDFYELFYDDAVTVAGALNLTLTSRDKNSPTPIPMCGVPLSVIDGYIDRLLPLGFSVAVVSQTGSGHGVSRELERFVTPGMRLFSDTSTDASESIIVAISFSPESGVVSFAFTDPQTGVIRVREDLEVSEASRDIGSLSARELVFPQYHGDSRLDKRSVLVRSLCSNSRNVAIRFRSEEVFSSDGVRDALADVGSELQALAPTTKRAVRLLVGYIDEISIGNVVPIVEITCAQDGGTVVVDAATRQNLELFSNARDGTSTGSLFNFINHTQTAGGRRLLRQWLSAPLSDISSLEERQRGVVELFEYHSDIANQCRGMSDLERIAARIQLSVASPKDLAALRDTLEGVRWIRDRIGGCAEAIIQGALNDLLVPNELLSPLQAALIESPPYKLSEGGIIKEGYDRELDRVRKLRDNAESWRASFELEQRSATGIPALKVRSNGVLGYFIEVSKAHAMRVPEHYQRRQSTANAERFVVPELLTFQEEITTAIDQQVRIEIDLFLKLREQVKSFTGVIRRIGRAVALLDVLSCFAKLAIDNNWTQPKLYNDRRLTIDSGRHPVIEGLLGGGFIPNSLQFGTGDGHTSFIVTGPNMGGKSTFLRQTAIITILAQIGSHVPAVSAEIGCVDKVFARLGASDNLHEGESTFMVEMREAAFILNNATDRSLVLIDELGRGTATSDGQALAQAILEELSGKRCSRTLFATHYHDLTELAVDSVAIGNLSVGSIDDGERIVFTHSIEPGPARRSYGIEVAKLSGLSGTVIRRASSLLTGDSRITGASRINAFSAERQGHLFGSGVSSVVVRETPVYDAIGEALKTTVARVDPDSMSPKQALELMYELCNIVKPTT